MTRLLKQKYWHELFEAGIALKAFNSVWETAGGILLLTGLHSWLSRGFVFITSSVFFAERHEFLFHILDVQLRHLNVVSTRTFVGAYLLFHGIMNAFLAYNLYRNRLWAYPTMIGFSSVFLVYQLYRLVHTHSLMLFAISIFDVLFIVLTWHEWRFQERKRQRALEPRGAEDSNK
jgi:uncharacterized membrane protein